MRESLASTSTPIEFSCQTQTTFAHDQADVMHPRFNGPSRRNRRGSPEHWTASAPPRGNVTTHGTA
jgi:hypothetical protein